MHRGLFRWGEGLVVLGSVVESGESRRHRARTLAGLFAAGATVSAVAVALPGWEQMHRAGIMLTVVAAAGGAVLLLGLAERIGRGACHAFTVSGTVLIGLCQALAGGGSATATYGMLYIWVVLHCAMFFSWGAVAAQMVLTALAHTLAVVWLGELHVLAPQLALTVGTQLAAALVVRSLVARMRQLADTDSLTGLGNRRVVDRALAHALAHSRRNPDVPTWVALLDLDGFKDFNDRHGHGAGDEILVRAADSWLGLLRGTDTLARTGGDEFTVVLTGCDDDQAEAVVRRLAAAVPSAVSCSAGLARWDGQETSERLVGRADAALYTAKPTSSVVVAATLPPAPAPARHPA